MFFLNRQPDNPHPKPQELLDAQAGGQGSAGTGTGSDVEALARTIERAGMSVPASIALQVGKPLSWMGGQLLWVLQPFTDALGIGTRSSLSARHIASMLERDGSVDALVERLDTGDADKPGNNGGRR